MICNPSRLSRKEWFIGRHEIEIIQNMLGFVFVLFCLGCIFFYSIAEMNSYAIVKTMEVKKCISVIYVVASHILYNTSGSFKWRFFYAD